MKKTLLLLTGTFLFSTCIVWFLFFYTTQKSFLNNFVRKQPLHALGVSDVVDLRYNNFYFAGASDSRIFLGNSSAPLYIFSADPLLKDTLALKLRPENTDSTYIRAARIGVNQNRVYLFDGVSPSIYQAIPEQGAVLRRTSGRDKVYFTDAVAYGPSSFAMRIYDRISRQNVLVRKIIGDTLHLEPAPGILQKQVDGIFCTDGTLLYNATSARLIYIYRYRNEFICMDTSMKVIYRGHTIDTTTHARIKVEEITSERSITMAAPPNTVNRLSCVYKNWLFVNSNLIADNENEEASKQSSVVDIYTLDDGEYQFSIYLFNIGGFRMHSFGVAHGRLFAVHGHYLVAYNLNPKYFTDRTALSAR